MRKCRRARIRGRRLWILWIVAPGERVRATMFRLETFVLGVVVLEEIVDSLAEEIVSFGAASKASSSSSSSRAVERPASFSSTSSSVRMDRRMSSVSFSTRRVRCARSDAPARDDDDGDGVEEGFFGEAISRGLGLVISSTRRRRASRSDEISRTVSRFVAHSFSNCAILRSYVQASTPMGPRAICCSSLRTVKA